MEQKYHGNYTYKNHFRIRVFVKSCQQHNREQRNESYITWRRIRFACIRVRESTNAMTIMAKFISHTFLPKASLYLYRLSYANEERNDVFSTRAHKANLALFSETSPQNAKHFRDFCDTDAKWDFSERRRFALIVPYVKPQLLVDHDSRVESQNLNTGNRCNATRTDERLNDNWGATSRAYHLLDARETQWDAVTLDAPSTLRKQTGRVHRATL